MTDDRGEVTDPGAASGLLHTLRVGPVAGLTLAPAEPRWTPLRVAGAPGTDFGDRFRSALIGGAIGDALGRPNEGLWPSEAPGRTSVDCGMRSVKESSPRVCFLAQA